MDSHDTFWKSIMASVRTHAVPIAVSVALSVAICRLSAIAALACLGIGGAVVMWLTGWRLTVITHQENEQPKEEESHGTDHHTAEK